MKKSILFVFTLMLGSALMISCSTKHVETEVPQTQTGSAAQEPVAQADTIIHYTVQRHDTLWGIAGKSDIYGDSFQWPLIFKSNRDKIQDPDLIYPDQNFDVLKTVSQDQVDQARKLASQTGKYKEHKKPRKKLSVDYF